MHEKLYEIGSEGDVLPENAAPWSKAEVEELANRDVLFFLFGMFFLDRLVLNQNFDFKMFIVSLLETFLFAQVTISRPRWTTQRVA